MSAAGAAPSLLAAAVAHVQLWCRSQGHRRGHRELLELPSSSTPARADPHAKESAVNGAGGSYGGRVAAGAAPAPAAAASATAITQAQGVEEDGGGGRRPLLLLLLRGEDGCRRRVPRRDLQGGGGLQNGLEDILRGSGGGAGSAVAGENEARAGMRLLLRVLLLLLVMLVVLFVLIHLWSSFRTLLPLTFHTFTFAGLSTTIIAVRR